MKYKKAVSLPQITERGCGDKKAKKLGSRQESQTFINFKGRCPGLPGN